MRKKIIVIVSFILLGGLIYSYRQYSALKSISTYEECLTSPGSFTTKMFPSVCTTRLGVQLTQPTPTPSTPASLNYDYSSEFSFKLGPEWHKTEAANPVQYINYNLEENLKPAFFIEGRDSGKLKIEVYVNQDQTMEDVYAREQANAEEGKYTAQEITLDGEKALLVQEESDRANVVMAIVKNPVTENVYTIVFALDFANYPTLRDQILFSFRFAD